MKIFLGIVGVLVVFGVGVVVGRLSTLTINLPELDPVVDLVESHLGGETDNETSDPTSPGEGGANSPEESSAGATEPATPGAESEAFRFSVANLPAAQQTILRTFGVTGTEIIITNAMFSCMQASISAERLTAIQTGDTPSFTEAVTLVRCYTAN